MGHEEIDVDQDGINSELVSILDSILSDFDNDLLNYANIDQSDIIASIDTDQVIERYINSLGDYDYDDYRGTISSTNSDNDIDDIFERT